jgi:hypothetical protein
LAAASGEQWQYLLDLETWRRDSLDASKTLVWLECLARANAARLAEWLFSEQGDLVSLILLRRAHVLFRDEEGQWDVPSGYVSLDGAFYIKAADPVEAQLLENFLRVLARGNDEAYWALLFNLSSYLPAETEEELYRLRSARLAEYGFPPFEEALAVYAPLEPSALKVEAKPLLPGALALDEEKDLIPVASFFNIEDFGFLKETLGRLTDRRRRTASVWNLRRFATRLLPPAPMPASTMTKVWATSADRRRATCIWRLQLCAARTRTTRQRCSAIIR